MRVHADPAEVRRALAQRLRVAVDARDLTVEHVEDPAAESALLLATLVEDARTAPSLAPTWLLLVALTASFPLDADVRAARRRLLLDTPAETMGWLLEQALRGLRLSDPLLELDIVRGGVVVDVAYTAGHDLNTGIQRVVRRAVPAWDRDHDVTLVSWTAGTAMRHLAPHERTRVLSWNGPAERTTPPVPTTRIVVPWESTVVLPEVPAPHLCPPIAAMAEHSGNAVSVIGYDCIPVVSADLMPPVEPERFARYLTVIKHARAVTAISTSAAEEFRGFTDMLGSQGLVGPVVTASVLPVEVPTRVAAPARTGREPLVLVVGSHEPRKNHLAVLHAAERLWREGAQFSLRFIGGSSWASAPFDAAVKARRAAGRDVVVGRAVHDDDLWAAYAQARFTVFPSVHEGYGLPVAESLGVGTPAITSNYGSTAEIGKDGGVLLVDPRSDDELLDAMRRLLTDDELLDQLTSEARARPTRSWDDFARDAWERLVVATQDAPAPDRQERDA